ncbi:hypothetical protein HYFRA_00011894 [Hymenoscyphus fraxineus]|uniref:Uncharacterized protein n=1 Tax=Hymenoscyphus fraxineus TaxID=746836 RepID=A0A9N9KZ36_9HELO|nr:hypothetical protein HYFRA_00011894 [Hymenoscyphus fraxineus]
MVPEMQIVLINPAKLCPAADTASRENENHLVEAAVALATLQTHNSENSDIQHIAIHFYQNPRTEMPCCDVDLALGFGGRGHLIKLVLVYPNADKLDQPSRPKGGNPECHVVLKDQGPANNASPTLIAAAFAPE